MSSNCYNYPLHLPHSINPHVQLANGSLSEPVISHAIKLLKQNVALKTVRGWVILNIFLPNACLVHIILVVYIFFCTTALFNRLFCEYLVNLAKVLLDEEARFPKIQLRLKAALYFLCTSTAVCIRRLNIKYECVSACGTTEIAKLKYSIL